MVLILVVASFSCSKIEDLNPHKQPINYKWRNLNITNYNLLLKKEPKNFVPFNVAILSNSLDHYEILEQVISYINEQRDIDFVIHLGNFTLNGQSKEYEHYCELIDKLNIPILTLLGENEYLTNGSDIYELVFGQSNLYFEFKQCRFVFFDNTQNSFQPNYLWFSNVLNSNENLLHIVPFSPMLPWSNEFSEESSQMHQQILIQKGIHTSLHGQKKSKIPISFSDEVNYINIPDFKSDELLILTYTKDTVTINTKNIEQ